jgi:hypothetical protein
MASMAYKMTNFMVFFNYAMLISLWIAALIFPTQIVNIPQPDGVDSSIDFISNNLIRILTLTAAPLALFAFSLLIPTIPFIILFYTLNGVIAASYVWQLGLPSLFSIPFTAGIAIITFMGIAEYSARQKV